MSEFETVAKVGDIPVDEGRAYEFGEKVVAVFNNDGEYLAIDDMCPHMGASLASGHFENCVVVCPWHSWSFDTRDGAWKDNPRIKIDTFQVRVVGDEIQVASADPENSDQADEPVSNSGEPPESSATSDVDPGLIHPSDQEHE